MITPSSTLTRLNKGNYSRLTFMMDNGVFWYFDRSGVEEVGGSGFQKVEGGCGTLFASSLAWSLKLNAVCDEQVRVTRSFYRCQ